MTEQLLHKTVILSLLALCFLNALLAWQVQQKLEVQPKDVLAAVEEKLEVTPEMVMQRLDEITAKHQQYMQALIDAAKKGQE